MNKSFIYTILQKSTNEILYVGSTKNIVNRTNQHKANILQKKGNIPLYKYLHQINTSWEDLHIDIVYENEYINKKHLTSIEAEYIKKLKPKCNVRIEGRTKQEYYYDNRNIILEKRYNHYNQNKERILSKRKEFYTKHRLTLLERSKAYYNKQKQIENQLKNNIQL